MIIFVFRQNLNNNNLTPGTFGIQYRISDAGAESPFKEPGWPIAFDVSKCVENIKNNPFRSFETLNHERELTRLFLKNFEQVWKRPRVETTFATRTHRSISSIRGIPRILPHWDPIENPAPRNTIAAIPKSYHAFHEWCLMISTTYPSGAWNRETDNSFLFELAAI